MLLPLNHTIRNYPWGSNSAIAKLLGNPPTTEPQAELWLGAHRQAPATIIVDGHSLPLDQALHNMPQKLLGSHCRKRFGTLPFLLKALAAARALSIQIHPNRDQALAGFASENAAGIPLTAAHRNYRDDNHKPEIICALTPMVALSGFRPIAEILENCRQSCPRSLATELDTLNHDGDLPTFFAALLQLPPDRRDTLLAEVLENARSGLPSPDAARWILNLAAQHPDDVGAVMPALLNLVHLQTHQALATQAGVPHAYLDGFGIELMATSDNVLRGGLTQKHVDVPELLRCLDCTPQAPLVPTPVVGDCETTYPTAAADFQLSRFELIDQSVRRQPIGPEILFCTEGDAVVSDDQSPAQSLGKGQAVFVAGTTTSYQLKGTATVFRASVPVGDSPPAS